MDLGMNPTAPFQGFCKPILDDAGASESSTSQESGGSCSFRAKNSDFQFGDCMFSCSAWPGPVMSLSAT